MAVLIDITYQTQGEVVLSSETDLKKTKYPFHLYQVNDMNFVIWNILFLQRSASRVQSVIPCTIKQLHSATYNQTEDTFKLGDLELNQVCTL